MRARSQTVPFVHSDGRPNPFLALLDEVRARVDVRLTELLGRKLEEALPLGSDVTALVSALSHLTLRGGKRFRPALLWASYRAVDEHADSGPALAAGVALELLQTYLLIHDDWMDGDETRRGGPAVHAQLRTHYGSVEMGDSAGVLAGDYAAALALETMAGAHVCGERVATALGLFAQVQQDAIRGQLLDLGGRSTNVEVMNDLKTGSYTVRGPMLIGAVLAGARPHQLAAMRAFANPLGVAFQLRDDLLAAFSPPETTGKSFGSDIRTGKRTALVQTGLARLDASDREKVGRVLGRADASEADVREVIALLEACGARAAVEARVEELFASALEALGNAELSAQGTAWLVGAARALTARDR
jgi:geranylgeranyl diphosphate synthase type I